MEVQTKLNIEYASVGFGSILHCALFNVQSCTVWVQSCNVHCFLSSQIQGIKIGVSPPMQTVSAIYIGPHCCSVAHTCS